MAVLKRAGTRSATWLAPIDSPSQTLDQTDFLQLPDDNALKPLLTATYADDQSMIDALGQAGFNISINFVGAAFEAQLFWSYARVANKVTVTVGNSGAVTPPSWLAVKLSVAYSASR